MQATEEGMGGLRLVEDRGEAKGAPEEARDEGKKDDHGGAFGGDADLQALEDSYYRLKHIVVSKNHTIPMLLQNENGPCPLLAICNILFLTGKLHVHPDFGGINNSDLLSMLGDFIANLKPPPMIAKNEELLANYKQNVSDALKVLPKLSAGLDINVKFTGIKDSEYTQECIVFDVLNINLVHGWIVDPHDQAQEVIAKYSYNQLMERLVERNALITRKCTEEGKKDDLDLDAEAVRLLPTPLVGDERQVISEGIAIQDFFLRTSTQLTYHGIVLLHQGLREGEFSVFFRNNHFSVLHKYKSSLYLLVTDVGYQDTPVVWEKLDQIDGDTILATYAFKIYQKREEETLPDINEAPPSSHIDNDFLLAQQLQEQEVARRDRAQRARSDGQGMGNGSQTARQPQRKSPPRQAKPGTTKHTRSRSDETSCTLS